MTTLIVELVENPFTFCARCSGRVLYRLNGWNMPCKCTADTATDCPDWTPTDGCTCRDEHPDAAHIAADHHDTHAVPPQWTQQWAREAQLRIDLQPEHPAWTGYVKWAALIASLAVIIGVWSVGWPW